MTNKEGRGRKVRMDKKTDVKPTVSILLKKQLYKLAELTGQPVKDLCENLCEKGQNAPLVLEEINRYFRRDYFCPPAIHKGCLERPRLKLLFSDETGKITIKFPQSTYNVLCDLAYSLDLPPTTTAAILLKKTLHNRKFMFDYVRSLHHLTNEEKNTVHAFLRRVWGFR